MDKWKKEIKRALCSRIEPAPDGTLRVLAANDHRMVGLCNGAVAVMILGIVCKERFYKATGSQTAVIGAARRYMCDIGFTLTLSSQPESAACLLYDSFATPVVLTFRCEQRHFVLTAWAARSVTGLLLARRAVRDFEKLLPSEIQPFERTEQKKEMPRTLKK